MTVDPVRLGFQLVGRAGEGQFASFKRYPWVWIIHKIESKYLRVANIWLDSSPKILVDPVALANPNKPFYVSPQRAELRHAADVRQVKTRLSWQIPAAPVEIAIWGIVEWLSR